MSQDTSKPTATMPAVWFVTGASRGLGAAIARAALQAGHQVVATARDAETVRAALQVDGSDRLLAVSLDVTAPEQIQAAVDAALAHFGRIDVLVNNAGYGQLGQFEEVSPEAVQAQFATNVFGLMDVTRSVLPAMRAQKAGHVFNISSIGGLAGFAGAAIYCSSKYAVAGFSASLAPEVAPDGIKVTSVLPGFFRTDFLDSRSVRYGDLPSTDHTSDSSAFAQFDAYNHQQPGNPAKLAEALHLLAEHPQPPLHFIVGADAISIGTAEIERVRLDVATWRDLSEGTSH